MLSVHIKVDAYNTHNIHNNYVNNNEKCNWNFILFIYLLEVYFLFGQKVPLTH